MSRETQPLLESSYKIRKDEENYGSGRSESEKITYVWSDLNVFVSVKDKKKSLFGKSTETRKHILQNVSGIARPGELLAILGASGAGKTTLLNALTFRSSSKMIISGFRSANGVPMARSALTSQSAYVQQEDLFFPNLTVREHLIFHALVRMDREIPYKARIKRVEQVIKELSLTKCADTHIGLGAGLSGGEKKRLAFASEVLTDPSLMFCDEPTSGLDSFMASNVVQVLKDLAKTGKTIICTIHQPSSDLYSMFDKVLLMAEGRVAFMGTPIEANQFFQSLNAPCPHNYNPADYYIQLLAVTPEEEESCRQAITMICDAFEGSDFGQKMVQESQQIVNVDEDYRFWAGLEGAENPYKASWFAQFRAVSWRCWLNVVKEPIYIRVRLLQTILSAFIIGFLFFGQTATEAGVMNINGAMFIFITSLTFQNIYAVVSVFCAEYPIFLREHLNGMYRTDVYFICKTLSEVPIFTLIPVFYVSVCYYMIGLNPEVSRFLIAISVVALVSNVSISFGYLVSCLTDSVSMALSIGPPINIPLLLFGGFFLNVKSIPVYFEWLSFFSWFRFGYESLMINQWDGIEHINCTQGAVSCPQSGEIVLKIYNFSKDNLVTDIVMLFALTIIFKLLAYSALLFKTLRRAQ